MLTNKGVLLDQAGVRASIRFSDLIEVNLAIHEEFKLGIKDKKEFTKIALRDEKGNRYIVTAEKGNAIQGIYQILHYVVSKKRVS